MRFLTEADFLLLDPCAAFAHAHPMRLGDELQGGHRVFLRGMVMVQFTIEIVGPRRRARHLSVVIQEPATDEHASPPPELMLELAAAFGFERAPHLTHVGHDDIAIHAFELFDHP